MSTDLTLAIRLKADGSDLIADVRLSKGELDKLGKGGAQAGEKLDKLGKEAKKVGKELVTLGKEGAQAGKAAATGMDRTSQSARELNRKSTNLSKSMFSLRGLMVGFGREGSQAGRAVARGMDGATRSTKKLRAATSGLRNKTKGLLGAFFSLKGMIAGLGFGFVARDVIKSGIAMEGYRNALKAVTGSSKLAAEELKFVTAEAKRLGLNLESTASAYTNLAASAKGTTLEGQGVRDIFSSVSEAARVMNLSADDTKGALRAMAQMMSKGNVQAEELRGQLGERIPGAFEMAAKAMGVTTKKLNDMLVAGDVLATDMLPKLAEEMRRSVGKGLPDAVNSADASFQRLGTSLFELKVAIAESGFLDFVARAADVVRSLTNAVGEFFNSGKKAAESQRLFNELISPNIELLRDYGVAVASIDPSRLEDVNRILKAATLNGIDLAYEAPLSKLREQIGSLSTTYGQIQQRRETLLKLYGPEMQGIKNLTQQQENLGQEIEQLVDQYVALSTAKDRNAIIPDPAARGADELKAYIGMLSSTEKMIRATYTPLDKLSDKIILLNMLWQSGAMGVETYTQQMMIAQKEFDKTSSSVKSGADDLDFYLSMLLSTEKMIRATYTPLDKLSDRIILLNMLCGYLVP